MSNRQMYREKTKLMVNYLWKLEVDISSSSESDPDSNDQS